MQPIRRVALVFSGGPAPAANAVISAAAVSFIEHGREVLGIFHGYSNLQDYDPAHPLVPDEHYRVFTDREVRGLRNARGVSIGTSRINPGKGIRSLSDLRNPEKTVRLNNVYRALVDLGVDALISIGGDGTLKTANFLYEYQKTLPADAPRFRVVHLPKTIDNDYHGIDFTFGYFTAVDVMAKELQNLRADAQATSSYFIVETMGRKAGWLAYGVAIAGEADRCLGYEDLELFGAPNAQGALRVDPDRLADLIVDTMLKREEHGEYYGTVVIAEGLAEVLPENLLGSGSRDDNAGHLAHGKVELGKMVAQRVRDRYRDRTGKVKKVTGVQLGYEARCAAPHAFDVMLGSQLGVGAYRGLIEQGLDGCMVSTRGQLELAYVPFRELINAGTLATDIRLVPEGGDFHRLARLLERATFSARGWSPGPRREA
jgi:6-phosphofructokinase